MNAGQSTCSQPAIERAFLIPGAMHMNTSPHVLDACCGSRMMWFDKTDSRAVFVDQRSETLTVTDRSHREDGTPPCD